VETKTRGGATKLLFCLHDRNMVFHYWQLFNFELPEHLCALTVQQSDEYMESGGKCVCVCARRTWNRMLKGETGT